MSWSSATTAVTPRISNVGDPINASPDGDATIGDAIGSELILRFPRKLRALVGNDHPGIDHIDDIDDVRPVYAVPAWVRQQSAIRPELFKPIRQVWSEVVDEFLANDFVSRWLKTQLKTFSLDLGKKLRVLLELSRNKIIQHGSDEAMTKVYRHPAQLRRQDVGARGERARETTRPALRDEDDPRTSRRCSHSGGSATGPPCISIRARGARCTRSATTSAVGRASCPTTR